MKAVLSDSLIVQASNREVAEQVRALFPEHTAMITKTISWSRWWPLVGQRVRESFSVAITLQNAFSSDVYWAAAKVRENFPRLKLATYSQQTEIVT